MVDSGLHPGRALLLPRLFLHGFQAALELIVDLVLFLQLSLSFLPQPLQTLNLLLSLIHLSLQGLHLQVELRRQDGAGFLLLGYDE